MNVSIRPDFFASVNRLSARLAGMAGPTGLAAADRALHDGAVLLQREAKALAPVGDGEGPHLRDEIEVREDGPLSYTVGIHAGSPVKHGPATEFGSRPHAIHAKPGKVLAFPGADGEMVYVKSVQHPGTKAQPFLRPAAQRVRPIMLRRMGQEIRDLLRGQSRAAT